MSSQAVERFLAKIYSDSDARARFLKDPRGEATRAGLLPAQCVALECIDRVGLEMAARSFDVKRSKKTKSR